MSILQNSVLSNLRMYNLKNLIYNFNFNSLEVFTDFLCAVKFIQKYTLLYKADQD